MDSWVRWRISRACTSAGRSASRYTRRRPPRQGRSVWGQDSRTARLFAPLTEMCSALATSTIV
ncbi:hypothetical protein BV505_07585 [Thermomonas haemolytica]|nr:hypothetical protein BV505_07585 [Thermomonas haemolytica]